MTDAERVIGSRIHRFESVTSTNDVARRLALEQADEGTVVAAAEQTLGRGSRGRKWISPAGVNLLFSAIMRPNVPYERIPELSFVASAAVARCLIDLSGLPAQVKWPNDVRVNGRKIAGMLIEGVSERGQFPTAIVGVGLNVNWRGLPPEIADTATSVWIETGRETDLEAALQSALECLDAAYRGYRQFGFQSVLAEWLGFDCTIGSHVTVESGEGTIRGRAEGVDTDGSLLVRTDEGDVRRVSSAGVIVDTTFTEERRREW